MRRTTSKRPTDGGPVPVPAEDVDMRRRIADWNELHGSERIPWLKVLHDAWREYNRAYFNGCMSVPVITIGLAGPRRFGFCKRDSDIGVRAQITIADRLIRVAEDAGPDESEGPRRFIRDVLLHEAVHQQVYEGLGYPWGIEAAWRGHGPIFRDECNRIGPLIGITEQVGTKHQRKVKPCAHWPHNVRPDGYYLGFSAKQVAFDVSRPQREPRIADPVSKLVKASVGLIQALERDQTIHRNLASRLSAIGLSRNEGSRDQMCEAVVTAIEAIMAAKIKTGIR